MPSIAVGGPFWHAHDHGYLRRDECAASFCFALVFKFARDDLSLVKLGMSDERALLYRHCSVSSDEEKGMRL